MFKKLSLVFDATVLANGTANDSGRSGIYFATFNILKELLKCDKLQLSLYCQQERLPDLKIILNELNQNPDELIIFEKSIKTSFVSFVASVKNKKNILKKQNKHILKFLLQLSLLILSPIAKLVKKDINENIFNLINEKDIYFSPMSKKPDKINIKSFIILYDLTPKLLPKYHNISFKKGEWIYDLCESLNSKDNYFAISNCTRTDFLNNYPVLNPDKITTTLLACDENFKQKSDIEIKKVKEKYNIPLDKKYVFSLCTLEPRKNLIRTIKTFIKFIKKNNINDFVFVLGGGHWKGFIDVLENEIENLGDYKDKTLQIGYVDDEDLPALYSGAEWFTYTSQYEGFGLPPLEAMSCGCPVITSNNSSLPEVVGDAGIMIDWDSDEQHIQAYEKYYYNEDFRQQMAQKGQERSKQFSWEKCANKMIEVMTK